MLILARKIGERICIGDDVVIEIRKIEPGRVSIGVLAPQSVPVNREELHCKLHQHEEER
jgi:carbon storage regulator